MPYVRINPIIRPVFLVIQEVARPDLRQTDITRSDTWTMIAVHPTADAPTAIQEIARKIRAGEVHPWLNPWIASRIIGLNLADLLADPGLYFDEQMLATPVPHIHIPAQQRPPWMAYT